MKIRSGFVSNSSSSSFIVGVAKIVDKDKLIAHLAEQSIKLDNFNISVVGPNEYENNSISFSIRKDIAKAESFQTESSVKVSSPTDEFLVVNIVNNEGDGCFMADDDSDLDHDIGYDFFDGTQQAVIDLFGTENIGLDIKSSDVSYGAGRNG
jgi:hypothetical protein